MNYSTGLRLPTLLPSTESILAEIRRQERARARTELIDQAIEVLNLAFEADPIAMQTLCLLRVRVNESLEQHPTIQIGKDATLGVIGVLNGLLGVDANGNGPLARIENDETSHITGFCRNTNYNEVSYVG